MAFQHSRGSRKQIRNKKFIIRSYRRQIRNKKFKIRNKEVVDNKKIDLEDRLVKFAVCVLTFVIFCPAPKPVRT